MRVGATLRALVTTPLRLGAATAPFLAYGRAVEALRAEAEPGPHWYLAGIGVDPAAQRQGIGAALLAPGHRGRGARRAARRAADEQRGQPRVLRGPRLRGRARGGDAARRPAGLGYGQGAVSSPPKRFPDRDEIAGVRAEAEALEAERRGRRRAPARRPRAGAARHGEARLPRPRRPHRPDPAPVPGRAHGRGRRPPRRRRRRDRQADEEPPRRAVADRRRARAALAHPLAAARTRSTASPTSSSATAAATSTC